MGMNHEEPTNYEFYQLVEERLGRGFRSRARCDALFGVHEVDDRTAIREQLIAETYGWADPV